jgi:drug/metabolite transporter (DMT)-like permease
LKSSSLAELNPNIIGIFWMLIAGLFFSVMVALIKLLGARFPSVEIVFFRSIVQLCVLGVVFSRIGFSSLKTERPFLHGFRALIAVALINCNFYAFTKLPLADVTAIGFSRNLFVVVLAIAFLGEKPSLHRLLATLVGFFGILVIVRPGSGVMEGAAWVALSGACLGAIMMTLIRKLTVTDSNVVMMTYPACAIALATAIPMAMLWVTPTMLELGLLVLMSCMGILGQWCLIQGFRYGETTAVAPASYVRLVFATAIGFYLFGEIPDSMSIIGALIIVGSNLFLVYQEGWARKSSAGERVPGDVT